MDNQDNFGEKSNSFINLDFNNYCPQKIIETDGEALFYPNFFNQEESDLFFSDLFSNIKWKQEIIKMFGKKMPIPRLTAWYGDEGKFYIYSGIKHQPEKWNETLNKIKHKVDKLANICYNSVLLNLYRHGQDSMAWHSDDELELGQNPIIASVSFGATRRFSLKHKNKPTHRVSLDLTHGSLLLMQGETQHYWLHQISKTKRNVEPRINLTFRIIK